MGLPAMLRVDSHATDELFLGLVLLVLGFFLGRHLARRRCLARPLLGIGGCLARAARRQVTDVAHARLHDEFAAEIFIDRLGLGRRLDDDQ